MDPTLNQIHWKKASTYLKLNNTLFMIADNQMDFIFNNYNTSNL